MRVRPSLAAPAAVLLLRTDASPEIGSGHVMRLCALADAHRRRGGRSLFALNHAAEPLHGALKGRGHEFVTVGAESGSVADIELVARIGQEVSAAAVVVDGGFAGLDYECELVARGAATISVDDGPGRVTAANVLINPNAGAERAEYRSETNVRLLCGPRYALLRSEFLDRRRRPRPTVPAEPRLLISFGGSDPAGGTGRVLRCLPAEPSRRLLVVLGGQQASAADALAAAADAAYAGHTVDVLCSPPDMALVMASAEAAISAGGGTLLELACLGCPALAFVVADNQARGCRALVDAGCAAGGDDLRDLGEEELADQIARFLGDTGGRNRVAERGRKLIDGLGAARALSAVDEHLSGHGASLEVMA